MSFVSAELLDRLEGRYRQLLTSMRDPLERFIEGEISADGTFADTRFVKVTDVLPGAMFAALTRDLLPVVSAVAEPVVLVHRAGPHGLTDGASFARVDPSCSAQGDAMTRLLDMIGLQSFGDLLAARVTPLVRHIAGDVHYQRLYCYVYREGDYVSVHDDHHVGDRVDVQFAHSEGGAGGIRTLTEGLLRIHYDRPGSMNVLGPRVWHDVPPLLRDSSLEPRRLNLGLRFHQ